MNKSMKVLVTGGCGFIGSHMVDYLLENGYQVIVIDNLSGGSLENLSHQNQNNNLSIEEIDIRELDHNSSIFKDLNYVYHFAGVGDIVPSIKEPERYISNNVMGTLRLLECIKHNKINKLVYAASSSCYGLADTPTNENHLINPQYPYALSKHQGTELIQHWYNVYKIPYNIICIFNAYGTRSRTSGAYGAVFGVFLKQKLSKKPFTVVGDGTQKRDFVNVRDLVEAFYLASITKITGEIFNVGSGNPQTINYLIELIGGGEKVYLPKRPGEPDITFADISKIKKLLNWEPKISFEEGVNEMLNNISFWEKAPLWDKNNIKSATKEWHQYLS